MTQDRVAWTPKRKPKCVDRDFCATITKRIVHDLISSQIAPQRRPATDPNTLASSLADYLQGSDIPALISPSRLVPTRTAGAGRNQPLRSSHKSQSPAAETKPKHRRPPLPARRQARQTRAGGRSWTACCAAQPPPKNSGVVWKPRQPSQTAAGGKWGVDDI